MIPTPHGARARHSLHVAFAGLRVPSRAPRKGRSWNESSFHDRGGAGPCLGEKPQVRAVGRQGLEP